MRITFVLNGQSTTVDVPGDMPLLWVLRDVVGLKGTKYGCGIGRCGTCVVHWNGTPERACQILASEIRGESITTIEGLSEDGSHPVQRAWEELDVSQCGYCQAGQIMSAAALLERTPNPSDAQIDAALNRNLCRCGTYPRIKQAVHRAAAMPATDAGSSQNGSAPLRKEAS